MKLSEELLRNLQNRLKVGNRRGVHLNAIPSNSRYKFDLNKLSSINKDLPNQFITSLLSEPSLKFKISWKSIEDDIESLFLEDQAQLVRIKTSLENLINQTNAIEAEKGVNTFGFGFPLIARKDSSDNKLTVAPLIIWSLRIRRSREYNTWEIVRSEDDPIYMNEVFINHVYADSSVLIEPLSDDVIEEGYLDHDNLANVLARTLNALNPGAKQLSFIETVNLMKNVCAIKDKTGFEKLTANTSSTVLEMAGLFSIFEVQKQSIIEDYEELVSLGVERIESSDLDSNTFQPLSSVETDPSQQGVLNSLKIKRNTLIQGPPGTGKSQTLTAVLLNALENGKKVLVVCEKRTALEVLDQALQDFGLDSLSILLRDVEKDRRVVVEKVKEILSVLDYNIPRQSKVQLNEVLKKAERNIELLNLGHQLLSNELIHPKTWSSVVAEYLKADRQEDSSLELELGDLDYKFNYEEYSDLKDKVEKGEKLTNTFNTIRDICLLNPKKISRKTVYEVEELFRNQLKEFKRDLIEIHKLKEIAKKEFASKLKVKINEALSRLTEVSLTLDSASEMMKTMDSRYRSSYVSCRMNEWETKCDFVNEKVDRLYNLEETSKSEPAFFDENRLEGLKYKVSTIFSKRKKQVVLNHLEAIEIFKSLSKFLTEDDELPSINFRGALKDKYKALDSLKELLDSKVEKVQKKYNETFSSFLLGSSWRREALSRFNDDLNTASNETKVVFKQIEAELKDLEFTVFASIDKIFNVCNEWTELGFAKSALIAAPIEKLKLLLKDKVLKLVSKDHRIEDSLDECFNTAMADWKEMDDLGVESYSDFISAIDQLLKKISDGQWLDLEFDTKDRSVLLAGIKSYIDAMSNHLEHDQDVLKVAMSFYKYHEELNEIEKELIKSLDSSTNWLKDFSRDYYHRLLKRNVTDQHLADDKLIEELNLNLKEIGTYQVRYIKGLWATKQNKCVTDFNNLNDGIKVNNLYNFRKSKYFDRFSLRRIAKHDKELFTSFFPVILTSPEVASTLFKGEVDYFDFVVFDEASQLRLEDNLPALMKGKQVVIAGDEHQMPPSNYFSKIFDGTIVDQEDDEESENENFKLNLNGALIDCESLLHFGENLGFNKRYLDFHYRSKHPFLIDFSNSAFYQNRLKPLPQKYDYIPIQFVQVNGTFSDHCNNAEAEMVLEIIDKSIIQKNDGSYPSVGVATFNISQRDLIEEKINERLKNPKFDEFNSKMESLRANGFFVKNLENIQGDERDIIILSTTYGKGADGKFHQRFGPLAQAKGHRLLNVIITRAKYKVFCCTSIPDDHIMSYKSALVTEGNRRKAVFYAYLAYCKAVSSGDTRSRSAVLGALQANNTVGSNTIHREDYHFDSEFEVEVYDRLVDEVGEQHLIPQLKVGGFRIDLVYKSPIDGVPMIAIECDGAKYHSSQEAYLYDLHRQKILEDQGFVFHRIWSTNWWRSPKMEMKRLVQFIKDVEAKGSSSGNVKSMIDNAYIHSVEFSTTELIEKLDNTPSEVNEVIVKTLKEKPVQVSLFDGDVVTQESKVKVLYRNTDDLVELKLVNSEKEESNNGKLRLIYYKKPLALAIIGKRVGDVVKIGKLDTYVEILEITN